MMVGMARVLAFWMLISLLDYISGHIKAAAKPHQSYSKVIIF